MALTFEPSGERVQIKTRDEAIQRLAASSEYLMNVSLFHIPGCGLSRYGEHEVVMFRKAGHLLDEIISLLPDMENLGNVPMSFDEWNALDQTIQIYIESVLNCEELGNYIVEAVQFCFDPYRDVVAGLNKYTPFVNETDVEDDGVKRCPNQGCGAPIYEPKKCC